MNLGFLREVFLEFASEEAVVADEGAWDFAALLAGLDAAAARLKQAGVGIGSIVALEADFSAGSIAHLLALIELDAVAVPLSPAAAAQKEQLLEIAQVEQLVQWDDSAEARITATGRAANHPLYDRIRSLGHPGLILFTSGYTGAPKAALHDGVRLLAKYRTRRHRLRTLTFLLFDHIGGFDTLLQALSNGCAVVIPRERTPDAVCEAIEKHRVEVLPAAPSFLGLLLLSEAHRRYDLSSLRYITYGAEVMPQATLTRLAEAFPGVTLLQKYGLTELGTLRSQSRTRDSLWVRVGGEGYETRVVDGKLEIKAESSMLGYLNAPSPFTEDGWFRTGDAVEVDGEFLRILGRASDLVNVGGLKVYPAEVETVIQEVENVREVAVSGEPHPFTGHVVVATVALDRPEDPRSVEKRVRDHCRKRLAPHMVPVRVRVTEAQLHSERQKLRRQTNP